MGLAEELYTVLLELGYTARRHKVPGPFANDMIGLARGSLELWRSDDKYIRRFATFALRLDILTAPNKFPQDVADIGNKLQDLLKYICMVCV